MVHPGGRKRTVSLPPEDMIALGEEMLEWVEAHPEALHLSAWYTIEKMFTEKQWETFQHKAEFVPYYESALKMIGLKYLDKTSNVRDSISHRWQRVYFKNLKNEEDAETLYKAKINAIESNAEIERKIVEKEHQIIEKDAKIRELELALQSKAT